MSKAKRHPCFNILGPEQVAADLDEGECEKSRFWQGAGITCIILKQGSDWEHCEYGAKSELYKPWRELYELSCACSRCHGTGRVRR